MRLGLAAALSQPYRRGAGAAVFVPATLPLTAFWKTYAGDPWAGSASTGTSGDNSLTEGLFTPPAVSGAHADFNGSTMRLTGAALSTYVTASDGYMAIAFNADAAAADGGTGTAYTAPCLLSDNTSAFSFAYTSAGVRVEAYDGSAYSDLVVAAGTGARHVAELWWTGGNITLRVDAATTDTEAWAGLAAGPLAATLLMGSNYNGDAGAWFDGKVIGAIMAATVPSADDRDSIVAYLQALP